jgi:hypothetical protein
MKVPPQKKKKKKRDETHIIMEFGDNMSFTPPFNSNVLFKSHIFMAKLWY